MMFSLRSFLFRYLLTISFICFALSAASAQARQVYERQYATLHLDNPTQLGKVDSALTAARRQLQQLLQDSLDYVPEIYVVDKLPSFDSLLGGKFPDWGAAAALPERGRIVIKSPDMFNISKSLDELVRHEYSHLALAHKMGIRSAPRWFDEGLAMLVSTEWQWDDNLAMGKAVLFGETVPLHEIDQVNRFTEGRAHVAYAESYLAVKYFYEAYQVRSVMIFLDSLASGGSIDTALMKGTGSTYRDFEKEFDLWLTEHYTVTTIFMDTIYFWMLLAIVLVIGAIFNFRKRRRYYKKWEEEEKYQSTDFDYGDPDNPEQVDDDEPWRQ